MSDIGHRVEVHEDGKKRIITTYYNGKKDGPMVMMDKKGRFLGVIQYREDDREGVALTFNKRELTLENYRRGRLHGILGKMKVSFGKKRTEVLVVKQYENGTPVLQRAVKPSSMLTPRTNIVFDEHGTACIGNDKYV